MLFSSLLCCLILECYYSVWSLWVSSHLFSWLFSVAFVWRKGPTWSLSAEITQDTQKHSTQTPTVLSQAGFMIPVCISLNIQVTCMHFEAWNFLLYNTGYIFRLKMGFSPSSTLLLSEPMEQKASFRLFWSSRVICGHPQPLSSVTTDPGKALSPSSHAVLPPETRGPWLLSSRAGHCSLVCMRCRNGRLCWHTQGLSRPEGWADTRWISGVRRK